MDTITPYEDAAGEWRWNRKAPNGRIICQGESHPRKYHAKRAARRANPDSGWMFADDERDDR